MDQKREKNSEKNMNFFFAIQKKKEQSDHEWKKTQFKKENTLFHPFK